MQLAPSAHVDTYCRDNLPPVASWPDLVFDRPELRYPERLNCAAELLDVTIARYGPDRPCLLGPTETWTYGEVLRVANQIAHVLVCELGVVAGNRVMLRGPNNPWLVACWLGALKAGAVLVTTMPLLRASELTAIQGIAGCRVVLCDHRFLVDLESADLGSADLGSADTAGAVIVAFGGTGADDLTRRVSRHPEHFANVDTSAEDVALLAFTSGTTGRPKATMHFHRDVLANADTFSKHVLRPGPDDVFTGTPPIAFTFGLGGIVVFPLRAGAATLLIEKATPDQLADLIAAYRVSICFTAPTAYRAILNAGPAGRLATIRRAVSAGEHLPATVWRAFHAATGVKLIDGIGATEMLHIFISAADDDIRPGSTGKAVPGYQATVLDDGGVPVPRGWVGRLAVKGPTGCRYLADPRQQVYVQNGWNITGDTYFQDDDGYFWYQARSDDMIISSGYNIAGPEVEEALLAHDDVLECAVVGRPDEQRGQLVSAFVVLRPGVTPSARKAAELQDFTKQQIAPYKYPRVVEFVESLPRTTTGKLQRFRLRGNAESVPADSTPAVSG